jgi:hypothetical protein
MLTEKTAAVRTKPRAPRAAGPGAYDEAEEVLIKKANAGGDADALLPVAHQPPLELPNMFNAHNQEKDDNQYKDDNQSWTCP